MWAQGQVITYYCLGLLNWSLVRREHSGEECSRSAMCRLMACCSCTRVQRWEALFTFCWDCAFGQGAELCMVVISGAGRVVCELLPLFWHSFDSLLCTATGNSQEDAQTS